MVTPAFRWLIVMNVTALLLVGLSLLYMLLYHWGWHTGFTVARHIDNLLLVACVVWVVSLAGLAVHWGRRLSGQN